MVKLFQKLAVSKGGALVARRNERNAQSFESATRGEFQKLEEVLKEGNTQVGVPLLIPFSIKRKEMNIHSLTIRFIRIYAVHIFGQKTTILSNLPTIFNKKSIKTLYI